MVVSKNNKWDNPLHGIGNDKSACVGLQAVVLNISSETARKENRFYLEVRLSINQDHLPDYPVPL